MSKEVLMFKTVHQNIRNTYNRLGKQSVSGTILPRGNFTDVCEVLANMMIIDLDERVNVELNVHDEDLNLIFSIKGGVE